MALEWVRITLRGYGGPTPTGKALFDLLRLEPDAGFATHPSLSPWQAASIELLNVSLEDARGA